MGNACNGMASIYIGKHTPTNHFVAIRQMSLEDCSLELDVLRVSMKKDLTEFCLEICFYIIGTKNVIYDI